MTDIRRTILWVIFGFSLVMLWDQWQVYNVSEAFAARLPAAAHVVRLRSDFARAQFPSAWSEALKASVRGELQRLFEQARP